MVRQDRWNACNNLKLLIRLQQRTSFDARYLLRLDLRRLLASVRCMGKMTRRWAEKRREQMACCLISVFRAMLKSNIVYAIRGALVSFCSDW